MFVRNWAVRLALVATIITPSLAPKLAHSQAQRSPMVPREELIKQIVQEAYDKYKGDTRGKNADYIPYLAQVDSKMFGIAIVTTDNRIITVGDVKYSFSIHPSRRSSHWLWRWKSQAPIWCSTKLVPSRPVARLIRRSQLWTCQPTPGIRT